MTPDPCAAGGIHCWDFPDTPEWLIATTPTSLAGIDAQRFEDRQMIVRLTFNRWRSTLGLVPPHLRPQIPSQDDAMMRSKRSWERLVQLWRTDLRVCAQETGGIDDVLDALTFDLCRALERLGWSG